MTASARNAGLAVAGVGLVMSAFHVRSVVLLWGDPAAVVANGLLSLLLSATLTAAGVVLARRRPVPDQFVGRLLGWAGVGALALAGAAGWLFLSASIDGNAPPRTVLILLNAVTIGSLGGLVVGVYDARQHARQRQLDQLNRITDTLRIATQAVVDAETRSELEAGVCEHLQRSDAYESAWIGRYDPETEVITPDAWAGLDDDYYESIELTVAAEEDAGQGAGGRAVRTGEIQCSQDVMSDPSMEPWRELFAEHGVESVAVVPIVHHDTVLGILSVYADRAYLFDDPEREVLTELGETIGHAVVSLEARERLRRRERELEIQNEHLEQFASVVSHDLRNPLNVAQGYLSMAREGSDDGTEHLGRVADALERMDELIEDVLTLARTGQTVDEFEAMDLEAVVKEAWESTGTDGATLDIEGGLGTVSGDASRVRELFENLFRNSVEHGSTGDRNAERSEDSVEHGSTGNQNSTSSGDAVTVTVGRLDDGTGFYVADDGPGIPEEDRETVFEAGYTTNEGGTGFGLNIVRNIADAHGWTVEVTASESGGARFEFTGLGADAVEDTNGRAEEPA